jgi:hypothetical protein
MNIIPDGNVAPSVKRIGPPRLMSVTEVTHVHEPSAFLRNESMKVGRTPPPSRRTVLRVTLRFKRANRNFLHGNGAPDAYSSPMKTFLVIAVTAALAGCGLDTASTAATAGSIKKQELEQGQKTLQHAQQKIDAAVQQMHQRAGSDQEQ